MFRKAILLVLDAVVQTAMRLRCATTVAMVNTWFTVAALGVASVSTSRRLTQYR